MMKIDFGETREEKEDRLSKWHKFFAIWPREVASHDYRFLEYVMRRQVFCIGWEYCSIEPPEPENSNKERRSGVDRRTQTIDVKNDRRSGIERRKLLDLPTDEIANEIANEIAKAKTKYSNFSRFQNIYHKDVNK
jgi:hypothetical protein